MSEPVPIGIAVVEHAGRYLVGVRGSEGPLAGKAEFPGGKCRPGESPRDCAVRECAEETGLSVIPVSLLLERRFVYPHAAVDLHFWLCRPAAPGEVQDGHGGFRWMAAEALKELDFPDANAPLIRRLLEGSPESAAPARERARSDPRPTA